MYIKFFFSLFVFCSIAFGLSTAHGETATILFLAGERSHKSGEHEFNAGCQLLAKALNEQSPSSMVGLKMSPSLAESTPLLFTPMVPRSLAMVGRKPISLPRLA